MEAIFSIKIWGSYRVYHYAELERFDTMIICESMRIRHELNTNWYDAVRCNTMGTRCNTKQYGGDGESIRLRYDVMRTRLELIGTYTNQCEHVRSNTTIRSLRIVLQRTESQQTGGESQCECTTNRYECITMRYEPIGTDTNWYDVRRCNTNRIDSQGQYECFEHFKTFLLACELIRKWQRTNTK